MSGLLSKCEEYYGTRSFYEVLNVRPDASVREIKKAYHELSLLVHPDRVEEDNKVVSMEKFKVLEKIFSILQNSEKRKVYDDSGEFEEDSYSTDDWIEYWSPIFTPVSTESIKNYEKIYIGSETEIKDVKRAYILSKGDIHVILKYVPFSNRGSIPRITQIVRKLIDNGEVVEYDGFFNESQEKVNKRRRKYEAEERTAKIVISKIQKQIHQSMDDTPSPPRKIKRKSDLLGKCEEYYGTRSFYEVLNVRPDASVREIKKAYHELSLLVHPDRVDEDNKVVSMEKFKVLGNIFSILQNSEKRKVYDDSGEFEENSYSTDDWIEYWSSMFITVSTEGIKN